MDYDELIFSNGFELINYYRQNPIIAARDLLYVDLDVIQRIVFRDMWTKQYTLLTAGRGAGKSVAVNSISLFENIGMCYLNELLPPIPHYLKDGETEECVFDRSIYTSDGFKNTKALSLEKNIEGRRLLTSYGFELYCGVNHPLLTYDTNGGLVYKVVTSFKSGDFICIQKGQNIFGNTYLSDNDVDSIIYNMSNDIDYDSNSYKLRTSNRASQVYFIKKIFSISLYYKNSNKTSKNKHKFLKELQLLLLNLNIMSYIYDDTIVVKDTVALNKLSYVMDYNNEHEYIMDKVVTVEPWVGDCYDFEMDMGGEPNYFANGFICHNTFLLGVMATLTGLLYPGQRIGIMSGASFRQAKMIFAEVEKLYNKSTLLQSACAKKPVHGSDTHYLEFKNVRGVGSLIQALPVGDTGSTIRGSRFYLLLMDELAQVDPKVLDLVIRPMSATSRNPMERVQEQNRRQRLIEAGLARPEDFEEFEVNRLIMASSGYFKFNHMWKRMCDYWNQIDAAKAEGKEPKHAVWQVPYTYMSSGFLDQDNIEEAKRNMSDIEFRMEYMAEMVRDSEGFFKASLLEQCSSSNVNIELSGDTSHQYVIGVDPNQGGSADCAIVVLSISEELFKVVYVETLNTSAHKNISRAIKKLCRNFNIVGIFVDKGGGGNSVAERLAEDDELPVLLTVGDEVHLGRAGSTVVNLINFSPAWISDANFQTLAMLEGNKLLFPRSPVNATSDMYADVYDDIVKLKMQMLSIVVTQNNSGTLHFDTPKKGQKKDLYSALILATHGAYIMLKEASLNKTNILCNAGYVRQHGTDNWNLLQATTGIAGSYYSLALLKSKLK